MLQNLPTAMVHYSKARFGQIFLFKILHCPNYTPSPISRVLNSGFYNKQFSHLWLCTRFAYLDYLKGFTKFK